MPAPQKDALRYKYVFIIKRVCSDLGILNTPNEYKDLSNHIKNNTPHQAYWSPDAIKDFSGCNRKIDENFISDLIQSVGKDYNSVESFISTLEGDLNSVSF